LEESKAQNAQKTRLTCAIEDQGLTSHAVNKTLGLETFQLADYHIGNEKKRFLFYKPSGPSKCD
jgi:hypothetical protein